MLGKYWTILDLKCRAKYYTDKAVCFKPEYSYCFLPVGFCEVTDDLSMDYYDADIHTDGSISTP